MREVVTTFSTGDEVTVRWSGLLDGLRREHTATLTDLERLVLLLEAGAQTVHQPSSEDSEWRDGPKVSRSRRDWRRQLRKR
jgi:hypothetical protein